MDTRELKERLRDQEWIRRWFDQAGHEAADRIEHLEQQLGGRETERTGKDLTEHVAKMMAVGNNGGTWATHYTEEQKEVWRERARSVIWAIQSASHPAKP